VSNSPPSNVINSLKLVKEELLSTIEAAAKDIEEFFSNTTDGGKLQASIEGLQQISGTLAMLQMYGPQCLANSILQVAQDITPGEKAVSDSLLLSLTNGFFLLPRYLEFLENTKTDHPELLLPLINELRACIKEQPLSDSYFFTVPQYPKAIEPTGLVSAAKTDEADRLVAANRLRHMYQIGLVALLQNKPAKPPLKMMSLALEKMASLYSQVSLSTLCYTASLALKSSLVSRGELSKSRKQALVALEKTIRQTIKSDPQGTETQLPRALTKDFVYWCAISPNNANTDEEIGGLLSAFAVSHANYTDKQLQKEAEILSGPSLNTIHSVISVFEEEIESAKRMLELASQAQNSAEFGALEELLKKLAEILSVIGLIKPSVRLKEQAVVVAEIHAIAGAPDKDKLAAVADALLQIESSVVQFKNQAGYQSDDDGLSQTAIADRQLAEAELIVLQEAETGLTLVKRALSAFAESNYDRAHIRNVTKTLATIKGGMQLMHRSRCATVLQLSERFIDEELMTEEHPSVLQQLLETFADCIISLEYYVTALQSDKNTDDSILQIAEESLNSLGLS